MPVMPIDQPIPMTEAATLLRQVIRGQLAMVPSGEPWAWGPVDGRSYRFEVAGWTLSFFNDGGRPEYISRAAAPDGRAEEFETWREVGDGIIGDARCPLQMLTMQELLRLGDLVNDIPASQPQRPLQAWSAPGRE